MLVIMRFVLQFIKVLKMSRLFLSRPRSRLILFL